MNSRQQIQVSDRAFPYCLVELSRAYPEEKNLAKVDGNNIGREEGSRPLLFDFLEKSMS
jgi:hypothetical protein